MITLFHDYTSPASAVAVARLRRLAGEGLTVDFEGFDVAGIAVALPVGVDVLAAIADLAEVAATEGVVLRRPPRLPPTALAHTVGDLAGNRGLGDAWLGAAYRAFWEDGADLASPAVLLALAAGAGLDHQAVAATLGDPARIGAVRRRAGARRREGVGGVPTLLAQRTLVPGLLPEADLRVLAAL